MSEPLWHVTRPPFEGMVFVDEVHGFIDRLADGSIAFSTATDALVALYAPGSWSVIKLSDGTE